MKTGRILSFSTFCVVVDAWMLLRYFLFCCVMLIAGDSDENSVM